MPIDVKVPSVGESVTSGILGVWKKKDGEYVRSGDVIFEIETDKVTSEVYADKSGQLKCMAAEGDEVQVGQVVAQIDDSVEAPASSEPAPAAPPASEEKKPETAGQESHLSPATQRIVEETGVNPAEISGTGKGGRLTKGDVIEHLEKQGSPAPTTSKPASDEPRFTRKKMTPLRKKIADRLVSAQHQAAMLTTFNECDMTSVMALRKKFQDSFTNKHGIKLGFMSFFVKAVIHALKQVPAINAQIDGEYIVENHFYDIGVAISTEKGLMVPVVRDPDQMNLAQIEGAIGDYAKKARGGKITLTDLQGGVFTITNGGVFGSLLSTPIINPPQSAILGMHTIQEKPVAINGQVVIRPMMYLALSYDHRLVDGKQAVTFLVEVKNYIENPGVALLDL